MPLLFLQTWSGSFSGRSCVGVWSAVPLLKGLGAAQVIVSCLEAWYYAAVGSLAFSYVGEALVSSKNNPAFTTCLAKSHLVACQVGTFLN